MKNINCPKCNAKMIHGNVETTIRIHGDVEARQYPQAHVQKPYIPRDAYICRKCGYIEFYAFLPEED